MQYGVYSYVLKQNGEIYYVGVDSDMYHQKRHRYHMSSKNKNKQLVNKILQTHHREFEYVELCWCDTREKAVLIEKAIIDSFGLLNKLNQKRG